MPTLALRRGLTGGVTCRKSHDHHDTRRVTTSIAN